MGQIVLRYYRVAWLNQENLATEGYLFFCNWQRIKTFIENMYDVLADDPSGNFLGELCYGRPQHGDRNTITAHRVLLPENSFIGEAAKMTADNSYYLWINQDRSPKTWYEARMLETKGILALRYRQPRPLTPPIDGISASNVLPYRPRSASIATQEIDGVRTATVPAPQKANSTHARLTHE